MFDFDYWCSWVARQCEKSSEGYADIAFQQGQPSSKRGATASFRTDSMLMQLAFWETGEADFYGLDLRTKNDLVDFTGRILDDQSFEETFFDCQARVKSPHKAT